MKRNAILLLIAACLLASCEYFGAFSFVINNTTEDTVYIAYTPQLRCWEDFFPTYDHEEDYEYIRLAETDTTITIPPFQHVEFYYDVGLVSKSFPTNDDTPENWDVVPLWQRISNIVIGTDTIAPSCYAKDKWGRDGSKYTLNVVK